MKKKIAVLFPGIGYTCDKPLLYYTGKLAVARGYKLVKVEYGNFPSGIKENKEKMEEALTTLHTKDLEDMINEDHGCEITCQFCNTHYQFSEDELKEILKKRQ